MKKKIKWCNSWVWLNYISRTKCGHLDHDPVHKPLWIVSDFAVTYVEVSRMHRRRLEVKYEREMSGKEKLKRRGGRKAGKDDRCGWTQSQKKTSHLHAIHVEILWIYLPTPIHNHMISLLQYSSMTSTCFQFLSLLSSLIKFALDYTCCDCEPFGPYDTWS